MKTNYKFSNLCGAVYSKGNLIFDKTGNTLLSPVGNRVSVYDLLKNKTVTLEHETANDISLIALNNQNTLLLMVDTMGRALLVNFISRALIARMNFKGKVGALQFSPDDKLIAVAVGNKIELWNAPGHNREFQPFVLNKTMGGHFDDILSITWKSDSSSFLTTSRDLTTRLYTLNDQQPMLLTGHSDIVLGAYFFKDSIYTISRDGALYEYQFEGVESDLHHDNEPKRLKKDDKNPNTRVLKLRTKRREYFNQNQKVISCAFHPQTGILSVGFDGGIFGLWELPDFLNIQTLSISQNKIDAVAVNNTGQWLAFGSSKLGQLLVWEWQSQSYVLKQQGHDLDMTALAYSPDGQHIATGGDDGKLKLWSQQTGFCFVTFTEHSGPIKALEFSKKKHIVFTASLDGTVRAYDLVRYRNFKTFTSPTPEQFNTVAVDPSCEIVCAASLDNFDIYMWSVQTGKLLEIMSGHEGPISSLTFSPITGQLVSASWDHTVRFWDIFARDKHTETIEHTCEVLAVAFSPDGKSLATTTLDGNINFWELDTMKLTTTIEGRKDIIGGRSKGDKMSLDKSASGKMFNSITFTSDGLGVLAGGNSKYVCFYDIASQTLIKRFQICKNYSLDRMKEQLNSKNMTEFGAMDEIDMQGDESDLEDRMDKTLPGVVRGDLSARKTRPEVRTFGVKFSPAGRSFSVCSTIGLIVFSIDDTVSFDPFDLELEINKEFIESSLLKKRYTLALLSSLQLGEVSIQDKTYNEIPTDHIKFVIDDMGEKYFKRFLVLLCRQFEINPRLEVNLDWAITFLKKNAVHIRNNSEEYKPAMKALYKCLDTVNGDILHMLDGNLCSLAYFKPKDQPVDVDEIDMELIGL